MSLENLLPELRDDIAKLPSLPFHIKPLIPATRLLYNFAAKSKLAEGVTANNIRDGGLEIRIFSPEKGNSGI